MRGCPIPYYTVPWCAQGLVAIVVVGVAAAVRPRLGKYLDVAHYAYGTQLCVLRLVFGVVWFIPSTNISNQQSQRILVQGHSAQRC